LTLHSFAINAEFLELLHHIEHMLLMLHLVWSIDEDGLEIAYSEVGNV
jgi:hypothetical protein